MSTLNKVTLIGNLGSDPEVKEFSSGASITTIKVATSEKWNNKQTGQKEEETEWHTVKFFGRTAEIASTYLHKGSKVYVEGRIKTEKWQDKEGRDRYTTVILGREMKMLDGRPVKESLKEHIEDEIPF